MSRASGAKKIVGYGFASWAIPFVVSLLFFEKGGHPRLPIDLIKSIMMLVGAGSGGFLLARLFRESRLSLFDAIGIGSFWLVLNLMLDLAILVPMTRMSLGQYFSEIGARYLLIPIMAAAMRASSPSEHVLRDSGSDRLERQRQTH